MKDIWWINETTLYHGLDHYGVCIRRCSAPFSCFQVKQRQAVLLLTLAMSLPRTLSAAISAAIFRAPFADYRSRVGDTDDTHHASIRPRFTLLTLSFIHGCHASWRRLQIPHLCLLSSLHCRRLPSLLKITFKRARLASTSWSFPCTTAFC